MFGLYLEKVLGDEHILCRLPILYSSDEHLYFDPLDVEWTMTVDEFNIENHVLVESGNFIREDWPLDKLAARIKEFVENEE